MRKLKLLHGLNLRALSATAIGFLIVQGLVAQPPGATRTKPSSTADTRALIESDAPPKVLGSLVPAAQSESVRDGETLEPSRATSPDPAMQPRPPITYLLLTGAGQVEHFSANRIYAYSMEAGAAKPRRLASSDQAAMGMSGVTGMGGMPRLDGMGAGEMGASGMGDMYSTADSRRWPTMYALVVDEAEGEEPYYLRRTVAPIQVVVRAAERAGKPNGAPMGISDGQDITSYGMASGMEEGMESAGSFVAIDIQEDEGVAYLPEGLRALTSKERLGLAQLVRIDVWIEDDCRALRANLDDPKVSRTIEARLRERLDQEYETLLARQRSDAERLRVRLERLEADLERRAKAKHRVIDVQYSKMLLEAQGLLDSGR